jgi:hypothetical protein
MPMRKLKMVCSVDGQQYVSHCDLPTDWDAMNEEQRREWEDECLETHITNVVDSWTERELG